MTEPHRHRTYGFPLFLLGWMAIVPLFGTILLMVTTIVARSEDKPPAWFVALWVSLAVWFWYAALVRTSFEVQVWPDTGQVRFRAALKTRETRLEHIQRIGPGWRGFDTLTITLEYKGGRAHVIRHLDGMHELITRVREANPAVSLRGV